MILYAVAHPVNVEAHPTIPPGWRWAVYRSDRFDDATECFGAGWAPEQGAAVFIADQAAAITVRALQFVGVDATISNHTLITDPIAAGADMIKIG